MCLEINAGCGGSSSHVIGAPTTTSDTSIVPNYPATHTLGGFSGRVKHVSGGSESITSDTTTGSNCSSSPCGSSNCQSPIPIEPCASGLFPLNQQHSLLNPNEFNNPFAENSDSGINSTSCGANRLDTGTLVPSDVTTDTLLRNASPDYAIQSPSYITVDNVSANVNSNLGSESLFTLQPVQSVHARFEEGAKLVEHVSSQSAATSGHQGDFLAIFSLKFEIREYGFIYPTPSTIFVYMFRKIIAACLQNYVSNPKKKYFFPWITRISLIASVLRLV